MTEVEVAGVDLWQWRRQAQSQAAEAGISLDEIDWLLQEIAGLDRLSLRLESFQTRPLVKLRCSLTDLEQLWQTRLQQHVPVQYLAGTTPWRQFSLQVSPAVLIPRPETELLIDLVLAAVSKAGSQSGELASELASGDWADLGTGSGAIALGLADALPHATIHAVDLSADALAVAQQNAQRLGLNQRIQFYQGSWFSPLEHLRSQLSGMVANPPYIPGSMIADLQPEVSQHEPHLALDGGKDGLDCIRELIAAAPAYLRSGGIWLIESMAGQPDAIVPLLAAEGSYRDTQIYPDLAGIERFVLAYRI
jgi:release factor glutamine methyltransferase